MQHFFYNLKNKISTFTTTSDYSTSSASAGQGNTKEQEVAAFTTTSERKNERLRSFFPSAAGEKPKPSSRAGFTTTNEKDDEPTGSSSSNAVGAKSRSSLSGFTLVEAVVAVSILLLVISGVMNIIHQGSATTRYQKDRITATYLASDAIEFIRSSRDSHWLASESGQNPNTFQSWATSSIPADCDEGNWCQVDTRQSVETVTPCGSSADNCDVLDYNTNTGLYGFDSGVSWQESDFTRSFTIQPDDLDTETAGPEVVKITSQVTWPRVTGGVSSVSFDEYLYGWRYAGGGLTPPVNPIIAGLQDVMSAAESYYNSNYDPVIGLSYEGVCGDTDVQQAVSNLNGVSDGAACWVASDSYDSSDYRSGFAQFEYGVAAAGDGLYYSASPDGVVVFDEEYNSPISDSWQDAKDICDSESKRLPRPSELRAVRNIDNDTPTGFDWYYHWSSLESLREPTEAMMVHLRDGYLSDTGKIYSRYYRCAQPVN